MERNEMIILGAVVVVAFVLLRKPAANKPGSTGNTGTGNTGTGNTGTGNTGTGTTGGGSGGTYRPEPIMELPGISARAIWPEAFTGGRTASPTQDPIAATGGAIPMPKIPLQWLG